MLKVTFNEISWCNVVQVVHVFIFFEAGRFKFVLIVFRCSINDVSMKHTCICWSCNSFLSALLPQTNLAGQVLPLSDSRAWRPPPTPPHSRSDSRWAAHLSHSPRACVCVKAKMSFHRGRELTSQHLLLLSKTLNSYSWRWYLKVSLMLHIYM